MSGPNAEDQQPFPDSARWVTPQVPSRVNREKPLANLAERLGVSNDPGMSWRPGARPGETPEDLTVSEWVGQALGAASMCWDPRPVGVFDSAKAGWVYEGLMSRLSRLLDEALSEDRPNACGTCKPAVVFDSAEEARQHVREHHRQMEPALGLASTRDLLEELRVRGMTAALVEDEHKIFNQSLEQSSGVLLTGLPQKVLDYRTVDGG